MEVWVNRYWIQCYNQDHTSAEHDQTWTTAKTETLVWVFWLIYILLSGIGIKLNMASLY